MKRVAELLSQILDELQVPIGIAISIFGLATGFVLLCIGCAILKLSGVV